MLKVLREMRKAQHLSQAELADKVSVTQGAVSAWEIGLYNPNAKKLKRLAKALNCTVDKLIADEKG